MEQQLRDIVFRACAEVRRYDNLSAGRATDLVATLLIQACSVQGSDLSKILVLSVKPALSFLLGLVRSDYNPSKVSAKFENLMKALMKDPHHLYGVKGRCHGERPLTAWRWDEETIPSRAWRWDEVTIHPFIYPVPILVDAGRADLLELIFKENPAPTPADALEVLAMALDASSQEPDPAVILTILRHNPTDVRTLIPRVDNSNGIGGHVSPLYYLLKTFYKAHVISPPSGLVPVTNGITPRRPTHQCDCPVITRDHFLVNSIRVLVQHGASWTQANKPSGETPLEVLAAILDGQDCGEEFGSWPCHNRNRLRAHVKLDWRAPDKVGEPLADTFNPIEVGDLKAKWA
jgi:hypothetical protein